MPAGPERAWPAFWHSATHVAVVVARGPGLCNCLNFFFGLCV